VIDCERLADESGEPGPRKPQCCGGWADYYGPCGATDCASCNPGWDLDEDDDGE